MTMNKEILRLAIPNILSNVSVPLLSTVDTALMGHLSASLFGGGRPGRDDLQSDLLGILDFCEWGQPE